MYLPKREELSLRVVFAFPNASRMGLVARICCSTSLDSSIFTRDRPSADSAELTEARNLMISLAYIILNEYEVSRCSVALTDSVLPAPLERNTHQYGHRGKRARGRDRPLSRDDNSLPLSILLHMSVRILRDSEQMGFQISPPSAAVSLDDLGTVKSDPLKWINGNQNDA